MLLLTITLLVVAAAVLAFSAPRPQPVRARRQPTREELLAALHAERDADIC